MSPLRVYPELGRCDATIRLCRMLPLDLQERKEGKVGGREGGRGGGNNGWGWRGSVGGWKGKTE